MRRYGPVILLVMLIAVPILLGRAPRETPGVAHLRIITSHTQDIRNEFRWAFSDWHQKKYGRPVELEFLTPGGTTDIQRQLEQTYRAVRDQHGGNLPPENEVQIGIDICWGGGDYFFNSKLKPLGILHPIDIDPKLWQEAIPQPALAGVKLYDQDRDKSGKFLPPKWIGICLSSFGIVYNPDLYHSLCLRDPVRWSDLTNEKLNGAVALADPTHSGSAAAAYMMIIQRAMADAENQFFNQPQNKSVSHDDLKKSPQYQIALASGWKTGMRQLLLIAANARYFSDSATQVPNDVASGDAAAGMAIDFYGRVTGESMGTNNNRCLFVTPPAATAITPDPIAILYGTTGEQLELANHLIEFLLTRQGQRLWIVNPGQPDGPRVRSLHRAPIRRDLYADRAGWSDDIDYYKQAGDFNQRGEWMAQMNDLTPLWAAAWIDDRDDLRSAYAAILAVPDQERRGRLIFELSDLPITMMDVNQLIAERKKIESQSVIDPDEWKASQRIAWARKFRGHYRAVAAEAGESVAGK